ncbi:MAG: recombination regulator RecX [Candidatus Omnitrophica bacterium]|nr:recombination regulator RecX [Candidatus Omnitrophota bacterium]MBU4487612.1 recombination regulator RecX [Candidatus Omnitrophota bacterium]MCG2705055.1 recombination regulator RecX [Candidatus Omnitrophota bacterium]
MKTDAGELRRARQSAYGLLKYRERSLKEIADRLKEKGFSPDICANVIAELQKLGYLDDVRFANALAQDILKFNPAGVSFIRSKLYSKGVPAGVADAVISAIKEDYNENETARRLAVMKAKRLEDIEPRKAKQRIYGFLTRRRFNHDIILDALSEIFKDDR